MSAVFIILWPLILASPAFAAEFQLEVRGCTTDDGTVMVAVYGENDEYLSKTHRPSFKAQLRVADGLAKTTVRDISAGKYAVAVYHDVDGNGVLNTNMLGIPTEPTAFSNGAKGLFGPPSFSKAAIDVGDDPLSVIVHLGGKPVGQ